MTDNLTTMLGHIAIIIVAVCNLIATLLNRSRLKKVQKSVNGKTEGE